MPSLLKQEFPEKYQRRFLDFVNGICHGVLVVDPELQTYAPQAMIVPRIIDIARWEAVPPSLTGPLKIVHAPSNRLFKGTDYVIDAVEKIRAQGHEVELTLIENMSHQEARQAYQQADVVVDQLRIGWFGVLAVEAMALGKAVVSYVRDDLKHHLPHPAPLVIANPDNIYDVLAKLAADPAMVRELGRRGREYVTQHHSAAEVSRVLLYLYQSANKPVDLATLWQWMDPDLKAHKILQARQGHGPGEPDGSLAPGHRSLQFLPIPGGVAPTGPGLRPGQGAAQGQAQALRLKRHDSTRAHRPRKIGQWR